MPIYRLMAFNEFKKKSDERGFKTVKAKRVQTGEFEKLDKALYIWFRQQRGLNIPVTGALQARTQGGFDGCARTPLFGTSIFNLQFWHSL